MSPNPTRVLEVYVPLAIRSQSRTVTWLWMRWPRHVLGYDRAVRWARWLP